MEEWLWKCALDATNLYKDEDGDRNLENAMLAGMVNLDGLEENGGNSMSNFFEFTSKIDRLSIGEEETVNDSKSHLWIF